MAIPAKRFSILDQETQLPVSGFSGITNSDILNSPLNDLVPGSTDLNTLINSAIQGPSLVPEVPVSAIDAATRTTQDAMANLTALTKLPQAELNKYLQGITNGDTTQAKKLSGLLQQCSANGMGYGLPGRPYDQSINCGAGKISVNNSGMGSGCDAGSYNNLLNSLTGGGYNAAFQDLTNMLRKLMALAGYGYNLGMCGVFGAVSKGMPLDVMSRGAGALLDIQGTAGNSVAVFDLASNVGTQGLFPLASNPGALTSWLNNYSKPSNVKEMDMPQLADRTLISLDTIDSNWGQSSYDGSFSVCTAENYRDDLGEAFKAKLSESEYGPGNLNVVPDNSDMYRMAAYESLDW